MIVSSPIFLPNQKIVSAHPQRMCAHTKLTYYP